jgi:hypothetical protein
VAHAFADISGLAAQAGKNIINCEFFQMENILPFPLKAVGMR